MKKKVVAPELVAERAKRNFDEQEMYEFFYGDKISRDAHEKFMNIVAKHPELRNNEKFFELNAEEMQENMMRRMKFLFDNYKKEFFTDYRP